MLPNAALNFNVCCIHLNQIRKGHEWVLKISNRVCKANNQSSVKSYVLGGSNLILHKLFAMLWYIMIPIIINFSHFFSFLAYSRFLIIRNSENGNLSERWCQSYDLLKTALSTVSYDKLQPLIISSWVQNVLQLSSYDWYLISPFIFSIGIFSDCPSVEMQWDSIWTNVGKSSALENFWVGDNNFQHQAVQTLTYINYAVLINQCRGLWSAIFYPCLHMTNKLITEYNICGSIEGCVTHISGIKFNNSFRILSVRQLSENELRNDWCPSIAFEVAVEHSKLCFGAATSNYEVTGTSK